jgi:hypothetical protein
VIGGFYSEEYFVKNNAAQDIETEVERLLVLMYAICEEKVGESMSSPQPPHDALCATALSLQEPRKAFPTAVRAT